MSAVTKNNWDQTGQHYYETGVDHGMAYIYNTATSAEITAASVQAADVHGNAKGFIWNGITSFEEKPDGADINEIYADNQKYLSLRGTENYKFGIEALGKPDEFSICDGVEVAGSINALKALKSVRIGQQKRETFGFSCRTKLGSDTSADRGYRLYIIYGATCSPSQKSHSTINQDPDAATFNWDCDTVPVPMANQWGASSADYKPSAIITIDVLNAWAAAQNGTAEATLWTNIKALEKMLYGWTETTGGTTTDAVPLLPTPAKVYAILSNGITDPTNG